MIQSKTLNENYFGYLLIEIIMVTVIMFIATGLFLFYSAGNLDMGKLEYLFKNPLIYACMCVTPSIISIGFLIYIRNRNYVVGYAFDHDTQFLKISYRKLINKRIMEVSIPFGELLTRPIKERKVFVNQPYKGKRIKYDGLKLDFITNNFIWEEHPREKLYFLEQLDKLNETRL